MPGAAPWGSVEAINAQTWHLQQQAAAAYAAQQAAPPIRELTPAERERLAQQAAERERARREQQEREEAERRAHDTAVAERERRLGWPAAQVRMAELESDAWRYVGFPQTHHAIGAIASVIVLLVVAVVGAVFTSEPGVLVVALFGVFALPTIRRWRKTVRGEGLRAELARLRTLRGCGVPGCPRCRTLSLGIHGHDSYR